MGSEYLVEGALLMCINGSKKNILKVPGGHGYTSGGRKKANCKDCKACENIPYFGECRKNKETHTCEGYMLLADKWENLRGMPGRPEKVNGEPAITMDSVLICKKGGLILPLTSGQGYEKKIDWAAFHKRFMKAMSWVLGKNLMCHIFGNDPINLNTGNYIYEKEDLVIPGITTLSFRLFYNSMEKGPGGCLGEGWHHNHEMHIREEENGKRLHVCLDDGRRLPYYRSIGDVYTPVFGDSGLLKKEESGFRYHTADGTEYTFDRGGLLLAKKDRNGNRDTYTHNSRGQLIRVSGANGGELFYTYNREGSLIRIKDHTGREVQLWYRYRKLWKFINASGHACFYDYDPNGKLESVTTPRGIRGVFNEYDAAGRVLKQTLPDGSVTEFLHDDENLRTYVKEANGSMVIHESDERFRNVKTVYEDGEELFAYNDRNQRTLYVDKNGNRTRYRYDEKGNLTGITDALGNVTEFSYNEDGRVTGVKQPDGGCISHTYNHAGQPVKTTDALGRSRETVYDERGLPVRLIQPDGSVIRMTHDGRGNLTGITNPYGETTTYTYDALNRVETSTDAEGNVVRYRYDERNHLTEVTDPAGNRRTYTYNESGKPVSIVDFDGREITMGYGCMNKPEQLMDKEGRVTLRRYDKMGNLSEETAPSGAVTAYIYDRNNRLERVEIRKEPGSGTADTVFTHTHDPAGNLLRRTAGDGKEILSQTAYTHDALYRVTEVTDPAGGKTVYAYDAAGRVSRITDPAGNRRSFVYNRAGELTEETDIHGNVTYYTYNALGQIRTVTDGAGRMTVYHYLPGGRLEKVEYPDGRERNYTYDALGRVKTLTDGDGYSLTNHYDCMGRLLRVSSSEGQEKSYTYDVMGNVTSMTDANGNVTTYEYSAGGKLTAVTDALGNRTEYSYDAADRLIRICQKGKHGEENRETFYGRNPLGQVEVIRDALGGEEFYTHDALGRVTGKTDREGWRTEYGYTADGKVERIMYGDGTGVEMEYTALRQLALVRDRLGETRIERNREGRPVRITDPAGRKVTYEWGDMGERRSITYPDGKTVRYGHDGLLRMTELVREEEGKENLRITYHYDGQGRLSEKRMPGSLCTRWSYNRLGLPVELVHGNSQGILEHCRYSYDAMGNRTRTDRQRRGLAWESGSYTFGYDALNRLESVEKDGKPLREYTYDSFGNRTGREDYEKGRKTACRYDALNRLLSEEIWEGSDAGLWQAKDKGISGGLVPAADATIPTADVVKKYAYDKRGNLTAEYQDGRLLHGYAYNAMNRLERAWDGDGREALYYYNGLGQRTGRCADGEMEEYLLDLTKPYHNLLEYRKGDKKQSFCWDVTVAVMEEDGRSPRYYLNDELGSPLRVVYGTGKGDVYGYDEFGNDLSEIQPESEFGTSYSRQGDGQPLGYTGYRYDDISGTYFAQAREYVPKAGRFTAEDIHWDEHNSIYGDKSEGNYMPDIYAIRQSLNKYLYGMNNPIRYIDLLGAEAGEPFKSADDAAEDFAKTTNGKSIQEDVEYGAYIYAWEEEKNFWFFHWTETQYSYTEPFTDMKDGSLVMDDENPPIPEGTRWVASAHTHGAWEKLNNQDYSALEVLNDRFSNQDVYYAEKAGVLFYLASPGGRLQVYDPAKGLVAAYEEVVAYWKLPHDRNHPELPWYHKKSCNNCFVLE